jgi:hypothetical protein
MSTLHYSTTSENKYFGYRILANTKRRTSSDNISTPNSGRSRSPSLLSSEYIPEEDQDDPLEEIINKVLTKNLLVVSLILKEREREGERG